MPEPERLVVLLPMPCEWCSTGLYRRRFAEVEVETPFGARARLCRICAEKVGGPSWPLVPVADTLPALDYAAAAEYLRFAYWTTAKTTPEYPHQYALLTDSQDPLMHLRVVRFIRSNGERRKWAPKSGPAAGRSAWCHYWTVGRYEYWTMPNRADPIVNRKPVDATD